MQGLALTVRALREASRSFVPLVLRGTLVLGLILGVAVAYIESWRGPAVGLIALEFVAWSNFVLLSLAGVSVFAGLITEEKEQRTLGLLRMAGFSSLSIMLGKSAGLLLNLAQLLVVQLPFCILAVTLGGVATEQVFGVFQVILGYAVLVYGCAMLASVVCRRSGTAGLLTGALLFTYHVAPFVARELCVVWGRRDAADSGIRAVCSAWIESLATRGLAAAIAGSGAAPLAVNCAIGGVAFLVAWFLLGRRFAEEPRPARRERAGLVALPGPFAPGARAVLQKDIRWAVAGGRALWWRVVFYLGFVLLMSLLNPDGNSSFMAEAVLVFGIVCLVLEAGLLAEGVFARELREQTWSALYGLPVPLGRTIAAKCAGAGVRLLPVLGLNLLGVMLRPDVMGRLLENLFDEPVAWFFFWQIVFGLVLTAWLSLRVTRGALVLAVAACLVIDVAVVFVVRLAIRGAPPDGLFGFLAIVTIGAAVCTAVEVQRRLRAAAAE